MAYADDNGDITLKMYDPVRQTYDNAEMIQIGSQTSTKPDNNSEMTSSSLKKQSTRRVLLFVALVFLLICVVVAAIILAVLLTKTKSDGAPPDEPQEFLSFVWLNQTYKKELSDSTSPEFKELNASFCDEVNILISKLLV
ncbi:hypothetical protein BsWGS_09671 [Bradybaena similaris]